jgi:hypothetical protein
MKNYPRNHGEFYHLFDEASRSCLICSAKRSLGTLCQVHGDEWDSQRHAISMDDLEPYFRFVMTHPDFSRGGFCASCTGPVFKVDYLCNTCRMSP